MLALGATLLGMVLGIRFRFVILFPVILVGSAALTALATINGDGAGYALLSIALAACLLQVGYCCTALITASILHGEDEEAEWPKPRLARFAWKRLSVPRDRA